MGLFNFGGMGGNSGGTSVQEEMKRSRRKGIVDVILCVVIVIAVLLFRESTGTGQNKVAFAQNSITLHCTEEDSCVLDYDSFDSVEFYPDFTAFDKGEMLRGIDTRASCSGVFRNEEFGEYYLCVTPKFNAYLVVHQGDTVMVFNYESESSTKDAFGFLQQIRADREP